MTGPYMQGHNTVPLVRLKPATLRSQVEHPTTAGHCAPLNRSDHSECDMAGQILLKQTID